MTSVVAFAGVPIYGTRTLVTGALGRPQEGASEVHLGRLKDGRKFLATVEPWHGTDVAIYLCDTPKPPKLPTFGSRTIIDSTLKDGHALWVADVDGDGDDEVFAGYRGQGTSLIGYDFDGQTWTRTVIDTAIAAQDLRRRSRRRWDARLRRGRRAQRITSSGIGPRKIKQPSNASTEVNMSTSHTTTADELWNMPELRSSP